MMRPRLNLILSLLTTSLHLAASTPLPKPAELPCPDSSMIPATSTEANISSSAVPLASTSATTSTLPTYPITTSSPASATSTTAAAISSTSASTSTPPASFSTLPALPSSALAPLALPAANLNDSCTSLRFTLSIITSISNPYSTGYTNATLATSLNNSRVLFTNDSTVAELILSSSAGLPVASTFVLEGGVLETWDGRVAYRNGTDEGGWGSVLFGERSKLSVEEVGGVLSCEFPVALEAAGVNGTQSTSTELKCKSGVGGEAGDVVVCEGGAPQVKSSGVLIGKGNPSGCVPVKLMASAVREDGLRRRRLRM